MALLLTQALFDDFSCYCTIPVFLAFANKVLKAPTSPPNSPQAPENRSALPCKSELPLAMDERSQLRGEGPTYEAVAPVIARRLPAISLVKGNSRFSAMIIES